MLSGRFSFANREYLQLFREANPGLSAEAIPRYSHGIFVVVASVCVISLGVLVGFGVMSLQERLAPSDAFLFGQPPTGSSMLLGATILLTLGPAFALAMYLTDRIRHALKIAPADPLTMREWTAVSAAYGNWRVAGVIAAALALATVGVGFVFLSDGNRAGRQSATGDVPETL